MLLETKAPKLAAEFQPHSADLFGGSSNRFCSSLIARTAATLW
jgi:hypothetical protein